MSIVVNDLITIDLSKYTAVYKSVPSGYVIYLLSKLPTHDDMYHCDFVGNTAKNRYILSLAPRFPTENAWQDIVLTKGKFDEIVSQIETYFA